MNDLISRAEAIRIAEQGQVQGFEWQFKKLCDLPSTQPRKGKWIRTRTLIHDGELYCDQCDQEHPEQKKIWNFCPNCGADMREGDSE